MRGVTLPDKAKKHQVNGGFFLPAKDFNRKLTLDCIR